MFVSKYFEKLDYKLYNIFLLLINFFKSKLLLILNYYLIMILIH